MRKILFSLLILLFYFMPHAQTACKTVGDGKNGLYVEYHANCNKKLSCSYKNAKRDGTCSEWWDNGMLKRTGTYQDGLKDGVWKHHDTLLNMKTKYGGNYKYGEITYDKGTVKSAYFYTSTADSLAPKNGETFVYYGKDTVVKYLVFYNNGQLNNESYTDMQMRLDSTMKVWDRNGNLLREEFFDKGRTTKEIIHSKEFRTEILYKQGDKVSLQQMDLSGKVFYEEYYDPKGKIVKQSGRKKQQ